MATYLDNRVVELAGETLNAKLQQAQDMLRAGGRVLVEVHLAGRTLLGDELSNRATELLGDQELRLISATPWDLAASAMQGAASLLGELREAHQNAAELLQRDQTREALQKLATIVQHWRDVLQAVQHSLQMLGITLQELDPALASVPVDTAVRLRTLTDCLRGRDTVGLADSLLYEWPSVLDGWEKLISRMLDAAEQEQN